MKNLQTFWLAILLSIVLPLASGAGSAHAAKITPGTLTGIITSSATTTPVVGATVKATNISTGAVTSTTSITTGSYKLTLAPATYSVAYSAANYQPAIRTGVSILAGKTTTVSLALEPVFQTLNHATRLSSYTGPDTCLACHSVSASGTDLLTDVFNSAHFQVRTPTSFIDMPGDGSHGMIDRACGLPGTSMLAGNFAYIATAADGTKAGDGCGKCHIAYRPPFKYMTAADARNDIDCLICHAQIYGVEWDDPVNVNLYGSNPQPHVRAVSPLADGTLAWSQDRSVKTAQSVGNPTSAKACLRCHDHNMSGYKRATPFTAATDVHAARNFSCTKCHIASQHKTPRGNFVTDMVANEQTTTNMSCSRCHGVTPHIANNAADLNKHTANVACEVCHIADMNVEENIGSRAWAPFTMDPRTGVWSDTRPLVAGSFYTPATEFHSTSSLPQIRWFDGTASMLAQPGGSYTTRESTGGCSKLFALKPFINGMLFDAGWLPGPSSDPGFDMVNGTWPASMKAYYENNWPKFLQMNFVDAKYPTAQSYWLERPDMAVMLNNFPMMLYMDRSTFQSEAGNTIGAPVPGPQSAATYPGIAKAINIGMGRIGIDMGYFPADSDPAIVGANLWSGTFFGMWAPINMDPTSPFNGELNSFITMSHSIKGTATLGTTMTSCYTCHYDQIEYDAATPVAKRLDFALLGWPNVDTNPIVDPLYDRKIETPVPAVERIVFNFVQGARTQNLRISTYIVDSITRLPLPNVTVSGTLTGPAGQAGLPYTASAASDSAGVALIIFSQRTLLPGTYTFAINSITYNGVTTPSNITCSYTKL